MKKVGRAIALRATGILLLLLSWWALHYYYCLLGVKHIAVPHPWAVAMEFWPRSVAATGATAGVPTYAASGKLIEDAAATVARVFVALAIGIIVGSTAGLLLGRVRVLYGIFGLEVDFFRSLPVAALFPIFMLILGHGNAAVVGAAAWSTSLVCLVNAMSAARSCSKTRLQVLRAMKATAWEAWKKLVLPESLPGIVVGARVGLAIGLIVVVMGEMFTGVRVGIGATISDAVETWMVTRAYAALIVAGLIGYVLNMLAECAELRVSRWRAL